MISSPTFPRLDYDFLADYYIDVAGKAMKTLPAPYYPVVTMGWDSSPRCVQSETYDRGPYPWMAVMEPTPEKFGRAIEQTIGLLKDNPAVEPIFFINAWNEWTEGSYLEPDEQWEYGFLEALKKELEK